MSSSKFKRKVCIVTGSRAEYGLLYPLVRELSEDGSFSLQIVATGMHLSPEFGLTYKDIEKDGFKIDRKVEMLLSSDTDVGVAKSLGLGIIGFADAFNNLKPNLLILLGDRFETYSAAISAYFCKIPIAHLHGGERTESALDEGIRHSITKMAYFHFSSTEEYRKRIIQLGEDPKRVFNVGAIGLDNVKMLKLLNRNELAKIIGFKFRNVNFLVTFHPVTLEKNTSEYQFNNLLDSLESFDDTGIIFTKANADSQGRIINRLMDEYVKTNLKNCVVYESLGEIKYLSALKNVDVIIGNSSSGIIEAPSFKKPTVNIGDRQKGRIRAESIIDCEPNQKEIKNAIKRALSKEFREICENTGNPYGDGNSAQRIVNILRKNLLNDINLKKAFYDLPVG